METCTAQITPTSVSTPAWVVCNMSIDPKIGFTQIGRYTPMNISLFFSVNHAMSTGIMRCHTYRVLCIPVHSCMERTEVRGVDYEEMGGYQMSFKYNVSWNLLLEIVRVSRTCKQLIRWECHSASIKSPYNSSIAITFWKNRDGLPRLYWGGAGHTTTNCACGMSDSCAVPKLKCNCDANDEVLREDVGHVSYKPDLPITMFLAGDTGENSELSYRLID